MKTAQDLLAITNKESGLIVYGNEMLECNWASIKGMPRVFGGCIIGLGEQLEGIFQGKEIIIYEGKELDCEKWVVNGAIVYCPVNWH